MLSAILAVEFFVDVAEVTVGDVCINLRRVDRGVTEELLDRTNVGAVTQEVGRECVTKRVRSNDARDAGARHISFQMPLHIARDDAV